MHLGNAKRCRANQISGTMQTIDECTRQKKRGHPGRTLTDCNSNLLLKYATPYHTEGQLPNMVHSQCASVMRVGSVTPLAHGMRRWRHPTWDELRKRRSTE
jgi:hypothetical protein